MAELGRAALIVTLGLALYALVAGGAAAALGRRRLALSARNALVAAFFSTVVATAVLVAGFVRNDFSLAYVADHSSRELPLPYKISAFWGGQEGSLLLWSWLLSVYAAVVAFTNRRRHRDFMPWVLGILGTVQTFFLVLNNFVANPFQMLATDKLIVAVPDGNGLSPLLQYPVGLQLPAFAGVELLLELRRQMSRKISTKR